MANLSITVKSGPAVESLTLDAVAVQALFDDNTPAQTVDAVKAEIKGSLAGRLRLVVAAALVDAYLTSHVTESS